MIAVWAPLANSMLIELALDNRPARRESMQPMDDGWWRWNGDPTAYTCCDYGFVLNGAEQPRPDPRSAWQPHGVHGLSRWFDTTGHRWSDESWPGPRGGTGALGGVLYEMHVGTFTQEGTFAAAINRLDHLVDLGVDVVEVMPIAAIPGRWGWGYDGVALYAVHDHLGGPAEFQRFVDACHGRGLGVCLDVVYNHLGPSGNYLAEFGPYFTSAHDTPWGDAVNLDQAGSEQVREFLIGNAVRWCREFHVDALRLDAVHALIDDGKPHFLAELSDTIAGVADELGRPLDLIAESDLNDVVMVTSTGNGGLGMSAQWDDDAHHALHVALTGETQGYYADFAGGAPDLPAVTPLDTLAYVLTHGFLHDGRWSSFRNRLWGRPIHRETFDARRLVTYLQTHDQVGNRAGGERIGGLTSIGRAAIGAALYILGPGTPMIFMGEEWGASTPWFYFTDFDDPALAKAVREGREREFAAHGWAKTPPDPQSAETRAASVLQWNERGADLYGALLGWYQSLISLRRSTFVGERPTHLSEVSCAVAGQRFDMVHGRLRISADLDQDAVTIWVDGIPTLSFPAASG